MGRKINPISHRIPVRRSWRANWFSDKKYGQYLQQDLKLRNYLEKRLHHAGIGRIDISHRRGLLEATIFTSKPGIVIGHKGAGIEEIQKGAVTKVGKRIKLNIKEIRKPEIWGQIMAEQLAYQLEKRINFRRAMKQILEEIGRNPEVQGAKVKISGRLGGNEISRSEQISQGSLPLQSLRIDIDYGFALARTKYGSIGVKVWINRGEYKQKSKVDSSEK